MLIAFLLLLVVCVIASCGAKPQKKSKAFLAIPLAATTTNLRVSEGWDYSESERPIHPDIPRHYAVDFPAPWGTPVYAPADGFALASYHLYDITDSQGRTIGFGLGLFIQIWHENQKLYTSYSHLSGISEAIPYIPPTAEGSGWQPRNAIYISVEDFKKKAVPVKRGDLIGKVGYTGLRLNYPETPANPPTVDPKREKTWDPAGPHLHWELFTRTPDGSRKDKRFDPFEIYGEKKAYVNVFKQASGYVLAKPDGNPQFAK